MADEVSNPDAPEGEVPAEDAGPPPPPPPPYWVRNWALPVLAIGMMVLGAAIYLWKGPLSAWHQQELAKDFQSVRERAESSPYEAFHSLKRLLPRLWRAPDLRGEAYYLVGRVNEKLANIPDVDPELARQYRESALNAFEAAERAGVPDHLRLPFAESWGRELVIAGSPKSLPKALELLSEANHRRVEMAWVIRWRQLANALMAEEPNEELIKERSSVFSSAKDAPTSLRDLCEQVAESSSHAPSDMRAQLDPFISNELLLPTNPQASEIDAHARVLTDLGELTEAEDYLQELAEDTSLARSAIMDRLSVIASRQDPPQLPEALEWARQRAELASLSEAEREIARLSLAKWLLASERPREARELLQRLTQSAKAPKDAFSTLGRAYLEEASQVDHEDLSDWIRGNESTKRYASWVDSTLPPGEGLVGGLRRLMSPASIKRAVADYNYQRAIQLLRPLVGDESLPDEMQAEYRLYIGVAESSLGQFGKAREMFDQIIHDIGQGHLMEAAQFQRADTLRRAGLDDVALSAFEATVGEIKYKRKYINPFLSQEQLVRIFVQAWQQFQSQENYRHAASIAQLLGQFNIPSLEPAEADALYARSAVKLAESAESRSKSEPEGKERDAFEAEMRAEYRQAGEAFSRVAKAREGTDNYAGLLWEAGTGFYKGHDFVKAIPILQQFIVAHVGGPRDFPARILIAQCHLSLGEWDRARKLLENALDEFRSAVGRFEARNLLAECYMEIADQMRRMEDGEKESAELSQKAEDLLTQNLSGRNQELEPAAVEWRDSLFLLGRIYARRGNHEQAIERLREFVRRFPSDARTVEAEHTIGESYLALGNALGEKIDRAVSEREKSKDREERATRWELAIAQFKSLGQRLTSASDTRRLTRREELLLSNALLRVGRIEILLGNTERGLDAYENLAYRYQNTPDCLAAYIEMSNIYASLGRKADADSALRQAMFVLDRMDDALFAESGRERDATRRQIESLLASP